MAARTRSARVDFTQATLRDLCVFSMTRHAKHTAMAKPAPSKARPARRGPRALRQDGRTGVLARRAAALTVGAGGGSRRAVRGSGREMTLITTGAFRTHIPVFDFFRFLRE
ncbi:hypothetical protein GCM10010360_74780 [Streptomyces nogalater]